MKILYISDVYFPRINGVSTSIQTFRGELQRLGHRVDVVAPRYGDEPDADGIIRVPGFTVPFDPEDRLIHHRAIKAQEQSLMAEGYDLIHIQTPFVAHRFGLKLARRMNVPVVETYHTFFEEYLYHYVPLAPRSWMRSLARRFSRLQCNRVDRVVVPSRAMQQALADYGVETPMVKLPTGLRPEELAGGNGATFREKHRIHSERPTLVHVGRVAFEKNISFLLKVLRRVAQDVPDVLMVIAGEGPALPSLKREAENLDLMDHLLFIGNMERATELMDCYRAADAFVFASRTETQGLVLLEAMALSVPVVSTAVMGTKDILDPGKGCIVAEEDEDDFSSKVLNVLNDDNLRTRLRREAHEYALGEWNAGIMAERLAAVYEELVVESQMSSHQAA